MRPIHALLLVLSLAAVLVGALLLVQSDKTAGRIAPPIAGGSSEPGRNLTAPELDPSGAANSALPGTERAEVVAGGKASIATGPIGLRGRVVDPEGRGVAGATVYAASSDMPMGFSLDAADGALPFMKRKQTTTDREGRFTLEPEAHGAVRLAVRADGFAPFNAQKPIAGTNVDVGDLKLERGVVLTGRVLDEGGRPVAQAALHLARAAESAGLLALPGSRGPLLAETDASGQFRIDRLAAGPWSLLVASADHPDKIESGETDRAGQVVSNLVITLEPGFDITGRVLGVPAGELGELRVTASERNEGGGLVVGFGSQRKSEIAADGGFRVRGCKRETEYRLAVRKSEHDFSAGTRSDTVTARSGDTNVVLTYRAETAITFKVVDRVSGQAIENMHVSAGYRWTLPMMEEGTAKARTNFPGGSVRFAPLAGGKADDLASLRIEAVGYATYEREDLRLTAGIDNHLGVIQLDRSALVRVRVLDASSGAPIQGASVSLNEIERGGSEIGVTFSMDVGLDEEPVFPGEGAAHRGKTDKEGRVSLSSLPGRRATLSVQHKEHAAWKSEPIDLPSDGDHEVTVNMLSGGVVVVEVVDRDQHPVAGLSIDHRDPSRRGGMFLPGMQSENITDAAGRVVFAHIPAGSHEFRARAPGSSSVGMFEGGIFRAAVAEEGSGGAEKGWAALEVAEGQTVTLTLTAPDLGELHGRVRESGKPLAGATVRLKPKGEDNLDIDMPLLEQGPSTTTNASGEYALAGSLVGEYTLSVTHPSRAMKWEGPATVRTGDTRLDVDLPLATIEGRVSTEDGKPIVGAKVSAARASKSAAGGVAEAVEMGVLMIAGSDSEGEIIPFSGGGAAPVVKTDQDGRYKLRGVTPGVPLVVVAESRDFQTVRSSQIELTTDQTQAGFDLVMKSGGSIEASVRKPDGRAVSGAILRAEAIGTEGASPKTLFTGPDGRVTFQGLAPGRWKVTCERTAFDPSSRDAKAPPREVEVRPGQTEKLSFDLPQ